MKLFVQISVVTSLACVPFSAPAQTDVQYYHTDALGSVVAMTGADGTALERNEYEPFGAELTGIEDGPGYTGHVSDATTGLNYMQQRYYDPAIGRFLSADPIAVDTSIGANFNRYEYANSNPYTFVDPDGREACGKNTTCRLASGERGGTSTQTAGPGMYSYASKGRRLQEATREVNATKGRMEAKVSKTPDGSAARFGVTMQPISTKYGVEIGSTIVENNGFSGSDGYKLTGTHVSNVFRPRDGNMFIGVGNYANIHTHPVARFPGNWFDPFSSDDTTYNGWVSIPSPVGAGARIFNFTAGKPVREIPTK